MYLKLKVITDSKIEKIEKLKDDEYRIWTKMPAENNLANTRVLEIIRNEYPNQPVRLISGHHSPSKIVSVG
ncbi:TPA: hypothetical protein DEP94_03900 [Candidatus Nomurabacteria bacterium]|nr:hypothetical protein [Candidatus Nomurabacteria bacterium]